MVGMSKLEQGQRPLSLALLDDPAEARRAASRARVTGRAGGSAG